MSLITLNINGQEYDVDVAPEMPLLWVLRDILNLTGTKYSCGRSLCGACTVHIDGEPVQSCVRRVSDIGSGEVTTIEGLAQIGFELLQESWLEEKVVQCGYCQAGQIMTAAALLAENPNPSDEEIDDAMSDNLCRCGTYLRIRNAIQRAAQEAV